MHWTGNLLTALRGMGEKEQALHFINYTDLSWYGRLERVVAHSRAVRRPLNEGGEGQLFF